MSSRVKTFACALVVGLIPLAAWSAEEAKAPGKQYNVVEVSLFDVNRKDFATKEAERAGSIPDDVIEKIQRSLIGIVTRSGDFPAVRKPGDAAA
ncbi:MAG TPA: hypothetical protein VE404_10935, partial [Verrucomicrobiae bacterium]|nr:hypothetical protein [Verrucomicrobiae bacterium]